jgi:hypothetical protein
MLIDLNQKLLFLLDCVLQVDIYKKEDERNLDDVGTLMYLVTGIDFKQN